MSALLMLAVSCKKDKNDEIENPGSGFRATVESHEGDSKTHLEGSSVKWDDNDAIMVASSTSDAKRFITRNPQNTGYDLFVADETLPVNFYTPNYTAYYPADMFDGNEIDLPGDQYYVGNTFDNGANPMAATSSDNVLPFKNICGVLELQLYSEEGCDVSCVTITSDVGEQLWGHGTVTLTDGIPSLSIVPEDDEQSTLWLWPEEDAVTLSTAPTAFYFVVPAGTLGKSFTVTVYDEYWDNMWRKTAVSPQNLIARSQITVMPPLEVDEMYPYMGVEVTTIPGCVKCNYTFSGNVQIEVAGECECEYGFVYAKTDDNACPTIGGAGCNKLYVNTETISDDDDKDFTADIPNLDESTDYSYRAYCICNGECYYGLSLVYSTPHPLPNDWVNGENPYSFTVGMDGGTPRKVYFSQGNLQYIGSATTPYWKFAEHQFDVLGDNGQGSADANVDRDLFGWGTSGYNHNDKCYQPWSTSYTYSYYYAYGSGDKNLYDSNGTADWGYNAISNGGNMENSGWRTLTCGEWTYLIDGRPDLWGQGKVGDCTLGLIILPDNWSWTGDVAPFEASWTPRESDWVNVYNYSEWAKMEAAGAVFLPTAGCRMNFGGIRVEDVGETGFYWSSSYMEDSDTQNPYQSAYELFFGSWGVSPNRYDNNSRDYGFSVRLVRPAE